MKSCFRSISGVALLLATFGLLSIAWIGLADAAGDAGGVFVEGPELNQGRNGHVIAALPDGRVIAFGGYRIFSNSGVNLNTAEVWDPKTNKFTTLNMPSYHSRAALARLHDGNYLVAGSADFPTNLNVADIFDPELTTFSGANPMHIPHDFCSSATLTEDKVLVVGGKENEPIGGDLYDPDTGSFTAAAVPNARRVSPVVLPTSDNQAVILGGSDYDTGLSCRQVELYNPDTNMTTTLIDKIFPDKSWVSFTGLHECVDNHRLPDGKYLLTARTSIQFLFTFDPDTKQIAEYSMSASLPGEVNFYCNPIVDAARGRAYLFATLGFTLPARWRLYTLNLETRQLNNPTGYYQLPDDFRPSYALTLLADGRLMLVGGEENVSDIYSRQASPKTWFITPTMNGANPSVLGLLLD